MAQRHKDAQHIINGACNPRAIVNAIKRAIEELDHERRSAAPAGGGGVDFADHPTINNDPAIRLMVYQLAHLTGVFEVHAELAAMGRLMDACAAAANDAARPRLTLHGLDLTANQEIAPGLFVARDVQGSLRAHNGQFFLGYVGKALRSGTWGWEAQVWNREAATKARRWRHTRAEAEELFPRLVAGLHQGEPS